MRCTVNIPGSKPDTQRSQVLGATYSSARKRLTLMDEICTDGGKQFDKFTEDDLIIVRGKFMDHEEVYYFVIWCLDSQQMC